MKRFLAVVLAVVSMCALALVGCGEQEEEPLPVDPLQVFRDGYAEVVSAGTVSQTVTAKKNKLVSYKSEKTYVLSGDGYTLTETVSTLNALDSTSADAYKSETKTSTVAKAETFGGSLKIDASSFAVGYTYDGGVLKASIPDDKAATVFALGDDHAPMHNVTLELTLGEGKLVGLKVDFVSGDYTVNIATTFAY